MTEAEWLAYSEPRVMLEFLRGKASERKLRLFACSCCRRLWNLFTDKRAWKAIEFAERYADGLATTRQLHESAWGRTDEGECVVLWHAWESASVSSEYGIGMAAKSRAASDEEADASWEAAFQQAWRRGDNLPEAVHAADATAAAKWLPMREAARTEEQQFQSHLLHDLFGFLLFRPVSLDSAWRTPAVLSLSEAAYEERSLPDGTLDLDRLAVLSDALEDAGCDSEEDCQICIGGVRMSAWEVYPCETCGGTGRVPTPLLAHLRGPGAHVRGCWVLDLLLGKV
jgi:hypothetical protein